MQYNTLKTIIQCNAADFYHGARGTALVQSNALKCNALKAIMQCNARKAGSYNGARGTALTLVYRIAL